MQILNVTADPSGIADTLVSFTVAGLAADTNYRVANFSELAGLVIGGSDVIDFANDFVISNPVIVQAAIDIGALATVLEENKAKTRDLRQEAKQFLIDNPAAQNIIDLDGPTLETTIENRTAAQETLLLKTLSFAVRFLFESVKLLD